VIGSGDRGDTLVEILISIIIMGIAGVAIITALQEGIFGSVSHRDAAEAESAMRYFAENVTNQTYDKCTTSPAHSAAYTVGLPSGAAYTALTGSITKTEYWDDINSTYSTSCPSDADRGLQRLTLKIKSTDNRVTTTVMILKRNTGYAP
jgi:type II secretory pathway pseudopilin PulG